jgi:predicted nucleic acid-binding protein
VLIVDAGPLYAAAASGDKDHRRCAELLANAEGPLLVPELVVCEVGYLLSERIGPHAEVAFARAIAAGELISEPVGDGEWQRVAELVERYEDLPLGLADASIVALAERYEAKEIASLDHRHLGAVKPKHVERLALLPR